MEDDTHIKSENSHFLHWKLNERKFILYDSFQANIYLKQKQQIPTNLPHNNITVLIPLNKSKTILFKYPII